MTNGAEHDQESTTSSNKVPFIFQFYTESEDNRQGASTAFSEKPRQYTSDSVQTQDTGKQTTTESLRSILTRNKPYNRPTAYSSPVYGTNRITDIWKWSTTKHPHNKRTRQKPYSRPTAHSSPMYRMDDNTDTLTVETTLENVTSRRHEKEHFSLEVIASSLATGCVAVFVIILLSAFIVVFIVVNKKKPVVNLELWRGSWSPGNVSVTPEGERYVDLQLIRSQRDQFRNHIN